MGLLVWACLILIIIIIPRIGGYLIYRLFEEETNDEAVAEDGAHTAIWTIRASLILIAIVAIVIVYR